MDEIRRRIAIHRSTRPECFGNNADDDGARRERALEILSAPRPAGFNDRPRREEMEDEPQAAGQTSTLEADCAALEPDRSTAPQQPQHGDAWNQQSRWQDGPFFQMAQMILQCDARNVQVRHVGRPSQDRDIEQRESRTNGRASDGSGAGSMSGLREDGGTGSGSAENIRLGVSEDEPSSSSDEEEPRLDLVRVEYYRRAAVPRDDNGRWSEEERQERDEMRGIAVQEEEQDFDPNGAIRCSIPDQPNASAAAAPAPVQTQLCTICYDREKNCAFVTCGHTSCFPCATNLETNFQTDLRHCPWCRNEILMLQPIFM
jgi:hypothetical protein